MKKFLKKCFHCLYDAHILPLKLLEEPFSWMSQERRMRRFKDLHRGKRCFVIGNGPSLNKVDLGLLRNEYTFGVNSIFYKSQEINFKPTFYVVEDGHVVDDNLNEINSYSVPFKFFPSAYRTKLRGGSNVTFFNMNRGFYESKSPNFEVPRFSKDCGRNIYCGQSVTIINLQLAFYMGFTDVYLIGMDFDYKVPSSAKIDGNTIISQEDDCNHFDPRYFGHGKKWHDPKLHNVLVSYKFCKLIYEHNGRRIFNATAGGKLEEFPRVLFESLF